MNRKPPIPTNPPPISTRQLFGTDGVRGVANEHPMTPELALRLGRAIAYVAGRGKGRRPRVVIGKDTRLSGYMLETALSSGICAMGGHVMLTGPMPTPAVAYLTVSMRADAGVVISASHNPYRDNGIKVFGPDGFKLPDEQELEIERLMLSTELDTHNPTGSGIGTAMRIDDAKGRYVVNAKQTFPRELTLDGIRVVVDAAHGAAYKVAPAVFSELGAEVVSIGCRPNGRNINRDHGALYPQRAQQEVIDHSAHLGVTLDGDADRVILIDDAGNMIDGDQIMALYGTEMLARGELAAATVVATVMSNLGLERAIEAAGGKLVRTAVGDRYVVEEMRRGGFAFGGEQSGHLIFLDHASTGDGIVAALQVLAIMLRKGRPLSELVAGVMRRVPQILKNVTLPARKPVDQMPQLSRSIASIESQLGREGRVLVRWSGTEPKLRVMVEGPDESRIAAYATELIEQAQRDMQPRAQTNG
ncbi:MAG TPA: phosphoglucosamine mutase [Polyangiaceae bacterium]|nr:phosphoglucosamine mutase [Polyangiaceae bacterium]